MNKRPQIIKEFMYRSKMMIILFVTNLIFLVLAFLTALIHSDASRPYLLFFIIASIVMLIHTAVYSIKTISLIKQRDFNEFPTVKEKTDKNAYDKLMDHQLEYINSEYYETGSNYAPLEKVTSEKDQNAQTTESKGKIYETHGETEVGLNYISSKMYATLVVHESEITLKGQPEEGRVLHLLIPDNHNCVVTMDHATLRGSDLPSINLGYNSTLILKLVGDNFILKNGIRVPETSSLTIIGEGDLTLLSEQTNRIGIGGSHTQVYGNITLGSTGNITITSSGNISLGIGGGLNTSNSVIKLLSGNISIATNGRTTLGIGSLEGYSNVVINQCKLSIKCDGTKAVGIGCLQGIVNVSSQGTVDIRCCGSRCSAIGTLEGSGDILIAGGTTQLQCSTNYGTILGAITGSVNIELQDGELIVHGEGSEIIGIGDHSGKSNVKINYGLLSIELFANNLLVSGTLPQKIIINGGNIQCDFPDNIIPVNSYGTTLLAHIVTGTDDYTQVIDTISYSYVYKAAYSHRFPYIKVYLPDNQSFAS